MIGCISVTRSWCKPANNGAVYYFCRGNNGRQNCFGIKAINGVINAPLRYEHTDISNPRKIRILLHCINDGVVLRNLSIIRLNFCRYFSQVGSSLETSNSHTFFIVIVIDLIDRCDQDNNIVKFGKTAVLSTRS